MQNGLLKMTRVGFTLLILAFGALPALGQSCAGWLDREKDYWEAITFEQVQACLDSGVNIKVKDKHGATPLFRAAEFNKDPKVIKALLDAGADANAQTNNKFTPLNAAAIGNKNPEVIKVLLDAGGGCECAK